MIAPGWLGQSKIMPTRQHRRPHGFVGYPWLVLRISCLRRSTALCRLVYGVTAPLVAGFRGVATTPRASTGAELDFTALIAMAIYAVIVVLVVRGLRLMFARPRGEQVLPEVSGAAALIPWHAVAVPQGRARRPRGVTGSVS